MFGVCWFVGGGDGLGVGEGWWFAVSGEVEERKRGAWWAYACSVYAEGGVVVVV